MFVAVDGIKIFLSSYEFQKIVTYVISAPEQVNFLCLPPSVTGEVYCFPRRQLIFSFGRRVIYHSKGL